MEEGDCVEEISELDAAKIVTGQIIFQEHFPRGYLPGCRRSSI